MITGLLGAKRVESLFFAFCVTRLGLRGRRRIIN